MIDWCVFLVGFSEMWIQHLKLDSDDWGWKLRATPQFESGVRYCYPHKVQLVIFCIFPFLMFLAAIAGHMVLVFCDFPLKSHFFNIPFVAKTPCIWDTKEKTNKQTNKQTNKHGWLDFRSIANIASSPKFVQADAAGGGDDGSVKTDEQIKVWSFWNSGRDESDESSGVWCKYIYILHISRIHILYIIFICLFIHLFICLFIYVFVYLCICLFIYLFVYLFF